MEREKGYYWVKLKGVSWGVVRYYDGEKWWDGGDITDIDEKTDIEIADRIPMPDEVCEWKHNVYTDLFRTECGKNVYKHVGIKWNFCPYCARKIKIID